MTNPNIHRGVPVNGDVRVGDFWGLLPKQYIGRRKEFFTYNVQFNPLSKASTLTQTVSINDDSDFVFAQLAVTVTHTDNTTFVDAKNLPILATISDASAGILMQNQATHLSNLAGIAQLTFRTSPPKIFRSGGQISVQLQNQDGVNDLVVNMAFHGFKVYRVPEGQ